MNIKNCPGFNPIILRHSEIWGAADEAVLNTVKYWTNPKNLPFRILKESFYRVPFTLKIGRRHGALRSSGCGVAHRLAGRPDVRFDSLPRHPPTPRPRLGTLYLYQRELRFFSLLFTVTGFYSPPLPWAKVLICNVNIVSGNLKSENSQDYAYKAQRNCTFTNSASG